MSAAEAMGVTAGVLLFAALFVAIAAIDSRGTMRYRSTVAITALFAIGIALAATAPWLAVLA